MEKSLLCRELCWSFAFSCCSRRSRSTILIGNAAASEFLVSSQLKLFYYFLVGFFIALVCTNISTRFTTNGQRLLASSPSTLIHWSIWSRTSSRQHSDPFWWAHISLPPGFGTALQLLLPSMRTVAIISPSSQVQKLMTTIITSELAEGERRHLIDFICLNAPILLAKRRGLKTTNRLYLPRWAQSA